MFLNIKCEQCDYTNTTEKGLAQHTRMKHKISQVDGNIVSNADDKDLEEAEVPDISHLVVLRNWVKEKHENVHLEPLAKVFCKVKGIGVYDLTCKQESFFYKFDDEETMEC